MIKCKLISMCDTWKLASYAGLPHSIVEFSGKGKYGKITKQGSPWLRRILVQCAMTIIMIYDEHFRTFYERLKIRKGHAKAIVAHNIIFL
jgi:transposase